MSKGKDGTLRTPVLLTGAGFTKNFGGFLASEMWQRIYGRVASDKDLKSLMMANFDFESVYWQVMSGSFSEKTKEQFEAGTVAAFEDLDAVLRAWSWGPGSAYPVDANKVRHLIARFAGTRSRPGFLFTLNQDLLLERLYPQDLRAPDLVLPGVQYATRGFFFSSDFHRTPLAPANYAKVAPSPRQGPFSALAPGLSYYIKLHGSYGWTSPEGERLLIIGRDKAATIQHTEIFAWYFDVFRSALASGRLLIVGYGFGDPHVNDALADSVVEHGLEIAVMDPTPASDLVARIRRSPRGEEILRAVFEFYPEPLGKMFPSSQETTAADRHFQESFFGTFVP